MTDASQQQQHQHQGGEPEFDPFAGPALSQAVPSTEAQREIWSAVQMGEDASCAFNESVSLVFEGDLDEPVFRQAVQDLAARHEALRSTFSVDGLTLLVATETQIPVHSIDLSALEPRERETELRAVLAREVETAFSLEQGPLFRVNVVRLGAKSWQCTFTAHHIVCDGWSMAVMLNDLAVLYSARRRGLKAELPPAHAFTSYARDEQSFEQSPEHAASERHWVERFKGTPPVLDLPIDGARPAVKTYSSIRVDVPIEAPLVEKVKKAGAKNGASFFATLLAAFTGLLHRISASDDVVVGIPAAGQSVTGMTSLVGHCVNTLPLRFPVKPEAPFTELLKTVRSTMLDGFEHQRYTYGSLIKKLPLSRDPSRLPLVSVLFNVDQAIDGDKLAFDGLKTSFRSNPRHFENFEIFINAAETKGRVVVEVQFNTDLFQESTIRRWMASFETMLAGIAEDPATPLAKLPILADTERAKLLSYNATFADFRRDIATHKLFEEQAARTPDAVAAVFEDASLTFGELDRRANQVARRLRKLGVKRETGAQVLVGLHVERSLLMLVGLVGILKAGGAYVPLDPAFPRERLAMMVEDSKMPVLVTQKSLSGGLPAPGVTEVLLDEAGGTADESQDPLAPSGDDARAEDAAYVIYTSGSTGKPKGVVIPHRAVVNFLTTMAHEPGLKKDDVLLAVTTLSFDIAVLELHLPLSVGAKIVLASRDAVVDGAMLLERIGKHGVNVMQATPSTWRLLLAAGWKGDPSFKAICGGEALPKDLAAELVRRAGELWNMYGPTETTVWSTIHKVPNPPGKILIGKPIANTTVYVLDPSMQLVPTGVPGELHIGGDGVTRGYWNREELTKERFVPDPFSGDPNARLYKTGDLVRFTPEGDLEYIRRNDNQVKVRGFRIELGEIETALSAHPSIKQAVVIVREDRPGDTRLVAYLITNQTVADADLRKHLRSTLPEYMVPQHFVSLDVLPLTPNGKIDRKALPAPQAAEGDGEAREGAVPPRTEMEKAIAGTWQEVLGIRKVGIHDNFFDLGGHSLLAAQVVSRLNRDHKIVLPLRKMFEAPTVAKLAEILGDGAGSKEQKGETKIARIPRRETDAAPRVSLMQQRIWFLEQLDPGLTVFNLPSAFRMQGKLDRDAFQRALNEVIRRQSSMRTRLRWEGSEAVQTVVKELEIDLDPVDLRALPPAQREHDLLEMLRKEAARPFDLTSEPLVRGRLYLLGETENVFFFMPHHAVWDGWSFDIFLHEMNTVYTAFCKGQASPLPELPITYGDFAEWHREWLQGEELERQSAYWRKQLSGEIADLAMPTDKPRPPQLTYQGQTEPLLFTKAEIDALTALARSAGVTLYMLMLAAFQVLLHRYTGQEDLTVGTPIRGRSQPETENVIGFFVNSLVLRTDLSGEPTFLELLQRVKTVVLDAFSHQDMPFELLLKELNVPRNLSRTALFQAFFTYQDVSNRASNFGDLKYGQIHVHAPVTPTDLSLWVKETGQGMTGGMDYATDLFERETIVRFLKQYKTLLASAVAEPTRAIGELTILPDSERRTIASWNDTDADYPKDKCVHQLFEAQVDRAPDRVALIRAPDDGGATMTYAALEARANQLAHALTGLGAGEDTLVGLCCERGFDMLVGMLGTLKAGAAYVPLDPAFPKDRIAFMVSDSKMPILLTQKALQPELPPHEARVLLLDGDELDAQPTTRISKGAPRALAYVIYTSGSTGIPKGVELPHRAVTNFVSSVAKRPGMTEADTIVAVTTLSFDIAVLELFLPLTVGAKIVLARRETAGDGEKLLQTIKETRATVMQATPATWRLLIGAGWEGTPGLKVICGGEALPKDLAEELVKRQGSLWNMYGPTETTVWSTCFKIEAPVSRILIGRPIDNTQVYVLDKKNQVVPIGVPGALFIGGDGVARGYLKRPELTASRFVADPFRRDENADASAPAFVPRIYETGDLARFMPDGNLEYLRRTDNQVKVRGYRIELGEIESALAKHAAVKQAVCIVREDRVGDARLVAYVVKREDATDTELRKHLRATLPDYMIPQHFVELETLPLTPNGKIDRKALPAPFHAPVAEHENVPPRTRAEKLVAEIFQQVLGVSSVSARDNFFDRGGHSLLSLKVIAQIERETGVRLNPRVLLLNTLDQVAAQLPQDEAAAAKVSSAPPHAPPKQPERTQEERATQGLFGKLKSVIKKKLGA